MSLILSADEEFASEARITAQHARELLADGEPVDYVRGLIRRDAETLAPVYGKTVEEFIALVGDIQ